MGLGLVVALTLAELSLRIVAGSSPGVRYLATAGVPRTAPPLKSLAEYLAWHSDQVQPHRSWLNHWTNSLGLHDQEFTLPKPPGRFRILALGDSFTYGLVPYEDTVMTIVEARLHDACPGMDLDLLNFGVGATGVHDYRTLLSLAFDEYEPDLVVIHFYAGNDGPDLFRHVHGRSPLEAHLRRSYLWTYGKNVVKLWRGVADPRLARRVERPGPGRPGRIPRGGAVIDPNYRIQDDDPLLVGPTLSEEAFERMMAEELTRLYLPREEGRVARAWRPVLEDLEAMRVQGTRDQARIALVVFPSALQVYPQLHADLADRLRTGRRHAPLSLAEIDPRLPNRTLDVYCREKGIPCLDVTDALVKASQESPAPLYKQRDTHWTVRGNRVAAEAEAASLVPLVCPRARRDRV
jgi:SGNH hydrolase-like domain, acetyltransferase AlgX